TMPHLWREIHDKKAGRRSTCGGAGAILGAAVDVRPLWRRLRARTRLKFMARSPSKPSKPVHTPDPGRGMKEAAVAFDHGRAPMFAPVTGPRLTPEEAPAAPADWVPHRPDRPTGKKRIPFRLETKYQPAGDQPSAIAELV